MYELTENFIRKYLKPTSLNNNDSDIIKCITNQDNFILCADESFTTKFLYIFAGNNEIIFKSNRDIDLTKINKSDISILKHLISHLNQANLYINIRYMLKYYIKHDRLYYGAIPVEHLMSSIENTEKKVVKYRDNVYTTQVVLDRYKGRIDRVLNVLKSRRIYKYINQAAIIKIDSACINLYLRIGNTIIDTVYDIRDSYVKNILNDVADYLELFGEDSEKYVLSWLVLYSLNTNAFYKLIKNNLRNFVCLTYELDKTIRYICNKHITDFECITNLHRLYISNALKHNVFDLEELTKIIITKELV